MRAAFPKSPRHRAVAAALIAVAAFALWRLLIAQPGPDDVAHAAANALAARDYAALLDLTAPEEVRRLNLNEQNVRRVLEETLFSHGSIPAFTVTRYQDYPVDQICYRVLPADGDSRGLHFPFYIIANESPDERWHLALAYLLLTANNVSLPPQQQETDYNHTFRTRAERYGIKGVRLNVGGYDFFADAEGRQ